MILAFETTKNFLVRDLDLKVSEGVGMVQRETQDQYLTSGKVLTRSIQCIRRI